jgi:hypothetical protein
VGAEVHHLIRTTNDETSTNLKYFSFLSVVLKILSNIKHSISNLILKSFLPSRRPKYTKMTNQAAWIKAAGAKPLSVEPAPTAKAGPGEVVVKNAFLAINPVDWKIQEYGPSFRGTPQNQNYPDILGRDIAGEIVEVGEGVTRLKVGQRVIA